MIGGVIIKYLPYNYRKLETISKMMLGSWKERKALGKKERRMGKKVSDNHTATKSHKKLESFQL